MRRSVKSVLVVLVASSPRPPRPHAADTARYILPPGNFGGLPTTDELARPAPALRRADARCAATSPSADINQLFLPENFKPDRRHARGADRPARACGSSTTTTASRTSTARRARTWPSAPAGRPRATAAC